MKNTVYILRGLPGCGKSTLAKSLTDEDRIFESDKYPRLYDASGKLLDIDLLKKSHQWCYDQFCNALLDGTEKPIVISNTSTQIWEYARYMHAAEKHEYAVQIIDCEALIVPSLYGNIVINEQVNSSKQVPRSMRDKMQARFERHIQQDTDSIGMLHNADQPDSLALWIFDRDDTLYKTNINNPHISSFDPIMPMVDALLSMQSEGNHITCIASNQGGLTTINKETELPHKTLEQLQYEHDCMSEDISFSFACYCHKIDGSAMLAAEPGKHGILGTKGVLTEYRDLDSSISIPNFRKPSIGMVKFLYDMYLQNGAKIGKVIFVGNGKEDEICARRAGIDYMHPWEFMLKYS